MWVVADVDTKIFKINSVRGFIVDLVVIFCSFDSKNLILVAFSKYLSIAVSLGEVQFPEEHQKL